MTNTTFKLPQSRSLQVRHNGNAIPAVLWLPAAQPEALVLACHGGSGHKMSQAILAIAGEFLPRGWAVLAIDGPVHGDRRTDGNLDATVARQSFREAWRAGVGRTDMADEMRAALDAAQALPELASVPVSYIGVSMGTAYGLPLLAKEPRIRAAAIGLWGATYPASEHLVGHAAEVKCPVWFTQQWNDEFFDREGTFALFDAIGSTDKRLVAYPGLHRELDGPRLRDAVEYICTATLT